MAIRSHCSVTDQQQLHLHRSAGSMRNAFCCHCHVGTCSYAAELFHWILLSSMSVYTNRQPAPGLLVPLQCQYLQHLYLLDFSIESCF